MPGIAGSVSARRHVEAEEARALATTLVSGAERLLARASGSAAMAHVAHLLPVDQGGIAGAGDVLVAAWGWVAGEAQRRIERGDPRVAGTGVLAPLLDHQAPPADDARRPANLADLCLARYLEDGADGICDLNGSHAIAVWDGRDRRLLLTQDRFGAAGLYYAIDGDRLLFASRPRALACAVGTELDPETLGHLLAVGHPLADRTLFRRIRALGPGEIATWNRGHLGIRRYWTWPAIATGDGARQRADAVEALDAACAAAIDDTVRAAGPGVELVLPLSGGLDSRALLGYLGRHGTPHTISYGHGHSRDRLYGARLARRAGVPHQQVELAPDFMARYGPSLVARTEGQASIHASHLLCLEDALRERPALIVSGFIGGTLFGPRKLDLLDGDESLDGGATADPRHLGRRDAVRLFERGYRVGFDDRAIARILHPNHARHAAGAAVAAFLDVVDRARRPERRADHAYVASRQCRFVSYQLQVLGAWAPVRAPFLDHRVLDATLRWPLRWRRGQSLYREFVRRRHADLARVPLTATGVPLAGWGPRRAALQIIEDCRWRYLHRWTGGRIVPHDYRQYAHYDAWIRGSCQGFFTRLLGDDLLLGELFDLTEVETLFRRHLEARVDAYHELCAIATVALWRQRFQVASASEQAVAAA